jgi:hypothetical protein
VGILKAGPLSARQRAKVKIEPDRRHENTNERQEKSVQF